ncbi:MAG TPA: class I SAM-dependent methyltransferase, partial [Acidimicrobiales bacterium]|nr:class I SAM-dependent methyltransferase [Acidimicrobiales bacterium]
MTHTERHRAESFGEDAELYDEARPGYPAAMIADLTGGAHLEVLDVGCATGKAGSALSGAGCTVLGVEIDERMAAVARSKGLEVEVGSFESWEAAGRSFDLVVCGQAWHWLDPAIAPVRAASVLRQGGRLAPFWNFRDPIEDPEEAALISAIYEREAPRLLPATSRVIGLCQPGDSLAGHVAA